MGHEMGSNGANALGELIARERRRCSLTRPELAELVRRADRTLGTDGNTVERWERGQMPQPAALRALAVVLKLPIEELTALLPGGPDAVPESNLTMETYSLASGAVDWRSLVPDFQRSADRLCRLYATRPPADLVPRVHQRIRLAQDLLRDGDRRHRRELAESAGWLYLLLAALHGGLGQMEAAWASRDGGHRLGLELGHGELIGWSYETAGWLSQLEGLWGDVMEAGEEGVRRSPRRSSALIQSLFKVAHAAAVLRDRAGAERALDTAADVVAGMDPSERPEHHFVFDGPKFDKFAADVYAEMGAPAKTAEHAGLVIARSDDASNPARFHPMRASAARVDMASALLEMGDLDAACAMGRAALGGPFVISETIGRVGDLLVRVRERYPREPKVMTLAEEYREAQTALAAIG
jgi:transcriptional regulator with XRE-family HTH domain